VQTSSQPANREAAAEEAGRLMAAHGVHPGEACRMFRDTVGRTH